MNDGDWDIDKLLKQYDTAELSGLVDDADLVKLLDSIKDIDMEMKSSSSSTVAKEDVSIYSQEGKSYQLGANIVVCKETVTCDEIRRLYVVSRIGNEANWWTHTPETSEEKHEQ